MIVKLNDAAGVKQIKTISILHGININITCIIIINYCQLILIT